MSQVNSNRASSQTSRKIISKPAPLKHDGKRHSKPEAVKDAKQSNNQQEALKKREKWTYGQSK